MNDGPPRSDAWMQATPRKAADEHVRRVVGWFANRLASDQGIRPDDARNALTGTCSRCHAGPGDACVQTTPAGTRRTGNLRIEVPHLPRRQAARKD